MDKVIFDIFVFDILLIDWLIDYMFGIEFNIEKVIINKNNLYLIQ